jgi:hypothetical protein
VKKKLLRASAYLFLFPLAALMATVTVNGIRYFVSYADFKAISAPANPASGDLRLFANSGTGQLACLDNAGASCMPTGGGAITYGPYASLPGTCTTGDQYFTSDSIYNFLCTGTNTWTPFYGSQKITIPSITGFGFENQGTMTAANTLGYIYPELAVGQAAVGFRMYVRALPAAPYTFTALIRENLNMAAFSYVGLCLRQDAADDNIFFGYNTRSATNHEIRVVSFTDNAAGGESVKASRVLANSELWFRIVDNNTDNFWQWSIDGTTFYTLYSAGRTSILTADQIGYSMSNENNSPISGMVISTTVTQP